MRCRTVVVCACADERTAIENASQAKTKNSLRMKPNTTRAHFIDRLLGKKCAQFRSCVLRTMRARFRTLHQESECSATRAVARQTTALLHKYGQSDKSGLLRASAAAM